VRQCDAPFQPNRGLEITPEFLSALLKHLRWRGYDIISLDAALERLKFSEKSAAPFVALTFDDGYRDFAEFALPTLERNRAPFVAYATSGFAEGSARLWWVELEEATRKLDRIEFVAGGEKFTMVCRNTAEKSEAFAVVYWKLREGLEAELLRVTKELCEQASVEPLALTKSLCLDWGGLRELARHELATIGTHTATHPCLAKLERQDARDEMCAGRAVVERELGVDARHFCYPVGDPTSAGKREFDLAAELGFGSAVTTRPGMLFPGHQNELFALPRVSINGRHQSLEAVDILLSGVPFALMNRGQHEAGRAQSRMSKKRDNA
jgi:peptidoglycan/xylan/chitin deacetylase (PgdA/CDA1 family)